MGDAPQRVVCATRGRRSDLDSDNAVLRAELHKDRKYKSFLRAEDQPALWLNKKIMDEHRPAMRNLYYDPATYDIYLEQLGIRYPVVR